ncbi:hypothetical protein L9F63_022382, partial [Diploptera punctata]
CGRFSISFLTLPSCFSLALFEHNNKTCPLSSTETGHNCAVPESLRSAAQGNLSSHCSERKMPTVFGKIQLHHF